jgi:hypothetical protein
MAMYVADFALAWTFGIVFQYFSIVSFQVGRIVGSFTSWPVTLGLIRRGWKEKM